MLVLRPAVVRRASWIWLPLLAWPRMTRIREVGRPGAAFGPDRGRPLRAGDEGCSLADRARRGRPRARLAA